MFLLDAGDVPSGHSTGWMYDARRKLVYVFTYRGEAWAIKINPAASDSWNDPSHHRVSEIYGAGPPAEDGIRQPGSTAWGEYETIANVDIMLVLCTRGSTLHIQGARRVVERLSDIPSSQPAV